MANNGFGRDTILLKRMIKESRLLKIKQGDHPIAKLIKEKLNNVIYQDTLGKERYKTKTFVTHTAWGRINITVTKINKIRQQNWFWDFIKLE